MSCQQIIFNPPVETIIIDQNTSLENFKKNYTEMAMIAWKPSSFVKGVLMVYLTLDEKYSGIYIDKNLLLASIYETQEKVQGSWNRFKFYPNLFVNSNCVSMDHSFDKSTTCWREIYSQHKIKVYSNHTEVNGWEFKFTFKRNNSNVPLLSIL